MSDGVGEQTTPTAGTRGDGQGTGDRRAILEMRDVSTHYGLISVLRHVNVEIFPGEIACLLGGNASGKTTTLKTILGFVKPSFHLHLGDFNLLGSVLQAI